jgi:DNA-directed RNA polymerase subunit RPC12/RpoP
VAAARERHRCDTCAAYLTRSDKVCYCACGAIHHASCLEALGSCPICKRAAAAARTETYDPKRPRGELCPACGRPLVNGRCACGAIAVGPSGAFDCPVCGGRVFGSEMRCSGCGTEFAEGGMIACQSCGRRVPAEEGRCGCGAYVGGRCRRCGLVMRPDDLVCPRCGRHKDLLR